MLQIFANASYVAELILKAKADRQNSSPWYTILDEAVSIPLYLEKDVSEDIRSLLARTLGGGSRTVRPATFDFTDISDPKTLLNNAPQGVYFLDIPPEEAHRLQAQYGVIVHSTQEPNEKCPLTEHIMRYNCVKDECTHSWETILSGQVSNSLIICDRYLFQADNNSTWKDGVANIKDILRAVLPPTGFKATYQVLIIYDWATDFGQIVTDLIAFAKQEEESRGYKIKIDLCNINKDENLREDTHDRKIVANYFLLDVTHMVKAFRQEIRNAENEQKECEGSTEHRLALCTQTMYFNSPCPSNIKAGSDVGIDDNILQRYAKILQAYNKKQKERKQEQNQEEVGKKRESHIIFNRLLDQYKEKDLEQ